MNGRWSRASGRNIWASRPRNPARYCYNRHRLTPLGNIEDTNVQDQTASNDPPLIEANAEHNYTVTAADLPLSCPMPGMKLWNSHPKVFLPIEETGQAMCPYCSASYQLEEQATGS